MERKCVGCSQHLWMKPREVVWTNPKDQKGYCVFHAPKEHKHISLDNESTYSTDEFNKLVYDRINEAKDAIAEDERYHHCNLNGTVFPGEIWFTRYNKDNQLPPITFMGAKFCGKAIFMYSSFIGLASFNNTKFMSTANFCGATFGGLADYSWCTFVGQAYFKETIIVAKADFRTCSARKNSLITRSISESSLQHICFSPVELPMFSFEGCRWPERLGLEIHGNGDRSNLLACEELYRSMKHRAAEDHDQLLVSRWHYREKLMALKRGGNGIFETAILWLDWALSGFGEKPLRAGAWLVALVALSFALHAIPEPLDWNSLWGANAINSTLALIPHAKDIPGAGWIKVGYLLLFALIGMQAKFIHTALSNRSRR